MENASKALIIAGAILISILIIGIGMAVITATGGVTDQVGSSMNAQELETFNSRYTSYVGENKHGSVVRTLINTVIANNAEYEDYKIFVSIDGTEYTEDNMSSALSQIKNTKRYNIDVEFDKKTKRVNKIAVTTPSASND